MRDLQADEDALERRMQSREDQGWDLKFQNFWGYTVAADRDRKKSSAMCEKFFTHIGLFR